MSVAQILGMNQQARTATPPDSNVSYHKSCGVHACCMYAAPGMHAAWLYHGLMVVLFCFNWVFLVRSAFFFFFFLLFCYLQKLVPIIFISLDY